MRAARAGITVMLHYFKIAHGNFGDALNPWLWEKLCPEICDARPDVLFLGVGTLLSARVPAAPVKVVFGSGCSGGPAPRLDDRWHIYCVRGPLTAEKLGLDPACALTDPAVLMRRFCSAPAQKSYPVSLMLHHQSMFQADWAELAGRAGFHCIDPRSGVETVLAEIGRTGLLLTEALHGAVVADALRVPWIPIRLYDRFAEFKWRDWTRSLQLPFQVFEVPPVYDRKLMSWKGLTHAFKKVLITAGLGKQNWKQLRVRASSNRTIKHTLQRLQQLAREQKPCQSADHLVPALEIRLLEKLSEIREAWRNGKFA